MPEYREFSEGAPEGRDSEQFVPPPIVKAPLSGRQEELQNAYAWGDLDQVALLKAKGICLPEVQADATQLPASTPDSQSTQEQINDAAWGQPGDEPTR